MQTDFAVANLAEIPSPSLLIFRERVEENLRRMLLEAGGPERLRPHVKTHKLGEIVRRQVELGITRCKTATLAESEMAASAGSTDVLLAFQPVGPNIGRFLDLRRVFPNTRFGTVVDHVDAAHEIARQAATGRSTRAPVDLWIDLDIGQHRTGIAPGPGAVELARLIHATPGLHLAGLHAYDGHLHDPDPAARRAACDQAYAPVDALRRELESIGIPVPSVVAGGTPTFPFHLERPGVECSPGTCVLWDAGYAKKLPDLDYLPAAALLARVVSRPTPDRICLDLGHKAVASEMAHPRVIFPDLPDAVPVAHNEEHLVLETPRAEAWKVGDALLGIPWHVCPTVALHSEVWVIEHGRATDCWQVLARARRITV